MHRYYSFSKHLWKAGHVQGAIFASGETAMRKYRLGFCFDIVLNLVEKIGIEEKYTFARSHEGI